MNRNTLLIIGGGLIIFVIGIVQFFSTRSAVSPTISTATSTTEQNVSTTTASTATATLDVKGVTVSSPARAVQKAPSIAKGDSIASWTFKGAYTDNPELVVKAENEIKRLSGFLAAATSSYMIIAVGIANQYELLGDGKKQYEYLERAIRADTNVTSGLPWHNLGVLMERLGALETARVAYEKSTIIQPELKQWHYAYLEFITTRLKGDVANIEKAFVAADKYFANDTDILQLRSEWQKP